MGGFVACLLFSQAIQEHLAYNMVPDSLKCAYCRHCVRLDLQLVYIMYKQVVFSLKTKDRKIHTLVWIVFYVT